MLVEIHILQNFAPACLNRDDTNAPKDCEFGGHRRARISSQCAKRAIRTSEFFKEKLGENIATRTKRLHEHLKDRLSDYEISGDDVDGILSAFITELYSKMDKSNNTSVALYVSPREVDLIIEALKDRWGALAKDVEKTCRQLASELREQIHDAYAADIALFGRMMAEKPDLNIDAASQVAHAISTNKVSMEMDFFTAVDDLLPSGETGAGMMGIVEYNSSCFYRYANVDLTQLMFNLRNNRDLAAKTVEGFLNAAILAVPTGKQTSMAAQNPPSFILAVVRENGFRCSLANAFVKPVNPDREHDLVEKSIMALDKYWGELQKVYGADGIKAMAACEVGFDCLSSLRDYRVAGIKSLVEKVMSAIELKEQEL